MRTTLARAGGTSADPRSGRVVGALTMLSALVAIPCPAAFIPAVIGSAVCVRRRRRGRCASRLAVGGIVATCASATASTVATLALVSSGG
ncbi:hypothetical protein [Plantibacter flavus]|uniref:hypothetical protein n=1 Tax=Plantibacter flavus TaxID=150123 RepID=UPI0011816DEA|nr:hypothetical protein [Plantibacter flavus]